MNIEIKKILCNKFNLTEAELEEMESDIDRLVIDATDISELCGTPAVFNAAERINGKHFKVSVEVSVRDDYFNINIEQTTVDEYLDFMNKLK